MLEHRIETHAHTSLVSPCGQLSPAELVAGYVAAGYSGLIVTDHLVRWLPVFDGLDSWPDRVHAFFGGFRAARDASVATGLTVYPGFELSFASLPGNDFLVYGLDEEVLVELPEVYSMQPESFKRLASAAGALVFQAHPFRNRGPVDPALLDGVEVYNGNPRHESRNDLAAGFAGRHQLLEIGGSDAHQTEDIGRAGITVPEMPETIHDLTRWYREAPDRVRLLVPDPTP
ncbi:MAG: PHP domain-containing protein [Spirochaetota bacterium]